MKLLKRVLILLFCAVTAGAVAALAACGPETPGGTEDKYEGYAITVRMPDGSVPTGEIVLSLCVPEGLEGGGSCIPGFTDEDGVAYFEDIDEGTYEVHIESSQWPTGCTFDDTKYVVTPQSKQITVQFDEAGPADLTAYVGSWHSLDGEISIDVEEDVLYFNDEPIEEVKEAANGAFFQLGDVSYVLSRHTLVSGALALQFFENEEILLPEAGLAHVSVPEELNGTWTCTRDSGITVVLDGSNFSYSPSEESISDGYIAAYTKKGENGTAAAVIEQGEDIGVYALEYTAASGYLTVQTGGTTDSFWKSGLGSEGDPTVINELAGDYSLTLGATRQPTGFVDLYLIYPVYYAYTPAEDETYVLWNPNWSNEDFILSVCIYKGSIEEETAVFVLDWRSSVPEAFFGTFTLEAGTQYRIQVCTSPDEARRPVGTVSVSFTITEGSTPPVSIRDIPEIYSGTWYNEADKTKTVLFQGKRALWNGTPFSVLEATNASVTGEVDGEEVVFTLSGATLNVRKGTETLHYTLISGHAVPVSSAYDGFYASEAGELIVIDGARHDADGNVLAAGSFTWVGHEVVVAAAEPARLILVVDDAVWVAEANGMRVTLYQRGSSASTTYAKCDYVNSFSPKYVGTFADSGNAHTITVARKGLTIDGTSAEVWRTGSAAQGTETLYFVTADAFYSLKKTSSGYTLTDLSTGTDWSLSPA